MIAKRVLIGLLVTLFLPAPRGNELFVLLNFPARVLAFFEGYSGADNSVLSDEIHLTGVNLDNLSEQEGYPVDWFDGLLEKEIENELEEDEGKDNKSSKYDFLSVLIQFHFDHESKTGYLQSGLYKNLKHQSSGYLVLRC